MVSVLFLFVLFCFAATLQNDFKQFALKRAVPLPPSIASLKVSVAVVRYLASSSLCWTSTLCLLECLLNLNYTTDFVFLTTVPSRF